MSNMGNIATTETGTEPPVRPDPPPGAAAVHALTASDETTKAVSESDETTKAVSESDDITTKANQTTKAVSESDDITTKANETTKAVGESDESTKADETTNAVSESDETINAVSESDETTKAVSESDETTKADETTETVSLSALASTKSRTAPTPAEASTPPATATISDASRSDQTILTKDSNYGEQKDPNLDQALPPTSPNQVRVDAGGNSTQTEESQHKKITGRGCASAVPAGARDRNFNAHYKNCANCTGAVERPSPTSTETLCNECLAKASTARPKDNQPPAASSKQKNKGRKK